MPPGAGKRFAVAEGCFAGARAVGKCFAGAVDPSTASPAARGLPANAVARVAAVAVVAVGTWSRLAVAAVRPVVRLRQRHHGWAEIQCCLAALRLRMAAAAAKYPAHTAGCFAGTAVPAGAIYPRQWLLANAAHPVVEAAAPFAKAC